MPPTSQQPPYPRIGIVGPCASGKSTLARALQVQGFDARQVSQEHSYVPDLWRRFSHCDVLIFLDVSLATLRRRLDSPEWHEFLYHYQRQRLRQALASCDLYIATDNLGAGQVLSCALALLADRGIFPARPDPL